MSDRTPLILSVSVSPQTVNAKGSFVISVKVEECNYSRLQKFTHKILSKFTHKNLSRDELK